MTTQTLARLWPLNLLDNSGLSSPRLAGVILFAGLIVGNLFGFIAFDRVPDSYQQGETRRWLAFALPIVACCVNVMAVILLARSTEGSLRRLVAGDSSVSGLQPTLSTRLVVMSFLATVPMYLVPIAYLAATFDLSLIAYFKRVVASDIVVWIRSFVTIPLWCLTNGYILAVFIGQLSILTQVAGRLTIDLANVQRYTPISEPFVRLAILTAVTLSLLQLIGLTVQPTDIGQNALDVLTVLTLLILGSLSALYLIPVGVLRARIHNEKQSQLDTISRALNDNVVVLDNVVATSPGEVLTKGELLNRQMFIESRWEWPIAAHVQQLVLFGLLPPLTWVLAAIVENILY